MCGGDPCCQGLLSSVRLTASSGSQAFSAARGADCPLWRDGQCEAGRQRGHHRGASRSLGAVIGPCGSRSCHDHRGQPGVGTWQLLRLHCTPLSGPLYVTRKLVPHQLLPGLLPSVPLVHSILPFHQHTRVATNPTSTLCRNSTSATSEGIQGPWALASRGSPQTLQAVCFKRFRAVHAAVPSSVVAVVLVIVPGFLERCLTPNGKDRTTELWR